MSLAAETAAALYGCAKILRWNADGLNYFNATLQGFWRSYIAALALAPIYAFLIFADFPSSRDLARAIPVEISAYVMGWVAYPLAMTRLAGFLGKGQRYFSYMVAYNWFRIVQSLALLPIALLSLLGLVSEAVAGALGSALLMAMLTYDWFLAREGLKLDGMAAAGLVVLDLVLSLFINALAKSLG
jgi:hypothetical protein